MTSRTKTASKKRGKSLGNSPVKVKAAKPGRSKDKVSKSRRSQGKASKALRPKGKCCVSKPRCKRCPIRMLAEGTLEPAVARRLFAKGRNRKQAKKDQLL